MRFQAKELKDKQGFEVIENRVVRRIFGPKTGEVTGGLENLHSGELHNLYSSPGTES
jgi:hypothetical protein